jgi:D-inositol-3-phosphate glycosyltransferase
MKRLLWVGDAGCDSGFARCTHRTLDTLKNLYEVTVLGLNYRGDPHSYPYKMFPCWPGGDMFGVKRIRALAEKADIVVIQNDPWNIPPYLKELDGLNIPIVGTLAVDSKNCRSARFKLNGLTRALFWTQFGLDEARKGGLTIPGGVVPLGVDLDVFSPGDHIAARRFAIGLPEECVNGFIVGNINRNQPRKRLDLTIRYFAEWVRSFGIKDAYLYLHVCPTGDLGIDCNQLANYYGLQGRLILAEPEVWKGASIEHVVATLRAFDVQINTALGEGWGLTTMEGMACGVPQIVPDWAAFTDWPGDAVIKVPCEETCFTSPTNQIGGVLDREWTVSALQALYASGRDGVTWQDLRERGLAKVAEPRFRWDNIGQTFASELEAAFQDHANRIQGPQREGSNATSTAAPQAEVPR